MQQAINTFIGGIASDSTPVSSSPQTLTDALNATLISNKGDQVEYQSLKSNVPILNSKRVQYVSTVPVEDVLVDRGKSLASIEITANGELLPGCEVLVYVKYLGIDIPEGYTYSGIEFRPGMFINVPYDPTKTVEYVRVTPQIPSVVPGTLVFYSKVYSEECSRNDCNPDSDGSTVSFTSIVNQFYSLVSQEDANAKAVQWVQDGKQTYANNRGLCVLIPVYWNEEVNLEKTRSNCGEGYSGGAVVYTVPVNTYSSLIGVTEANLLAFADAEANAQSYADVEGTCILIPVYWNEEQTVTRTRNDCEEGSVGSEVPFTIEANLFSSFVDQSSANRLALEAANAGAQANANVLGTCTIGTYTNEEQTATATRDNCGVGYEGSLETFTIAPGTYFSLVSLDDANSQALTAATAGAQAHANSVGSCTLVNNITWNSYTSSPDYRDYAEIYKNGISVVHKSEGTFSGTLNAVDGDSFDVVAFNPASNGSDQGAKVTVTSSTVGEIYSNTMFGYDANNTYTYVYNSSHGIVTFEMFAPVAHEAL